MTDFRDKFIEKGYWFPIIFAIFVMMLIAVWNTAKGQTPYEVYRECVAQGIEHPDIVTKQSILETGWYKCEQCALRYNNIFGFRLGYTATEENPLGYLKFDHWKDCVKYYAKWQRKWYNGESYYKFLENIGYATSETYISKLKSIEI